MYGVFVWDNLHIIRGEIGHGFLGAGVGVTLAHAYKLSIGRGTRRETQIRHNGVRLTKEAVITLEHLYIRIRRANVFLGASLPEEMVLCGPFLEAMLLTSCR